MFDLALALIAVEEQFSARVLSQTDNQELSFLRVIRTMKILKLLRIVRLIRGLGELRIMLGSMLGSMRVMLWSTSLIFSLCFVFAVCFLQAAADHLSKGGTVDQAATSLDGVWNHDLFLIYWSSLGNAMSTLFQASSGGLDWGIVADMLWEVGPQFYVLFFLYIFISMFVLFNLLTSIFVDSVRDLSQQDLARSMQEHVKNKQKYMDLLVLLFEKMDKDGGGDVSYDEFSEHRNDPVMSVFAEKLQIEPTDLEDFFALISAGGRRRVDLETFVVGAIKLRGLAKSMDIMEVQSAQHDFSSDFKKFREQCLNDLQSVCRACERLALEQAKLRDDLGSGLVMPVMSMQRPSMTTPVQKATAFREAGI